MLPIISPRRTAVSSGGTVMLFATLRRGGEACAKLTGRIPRRRFGPLWQCDPLFR
jgi:hypothetical protein